MNAPSPHAHRRLFTALVGLTVFRDLLSLHVPRSIFSADGAFTLPWGAWVPVPTASLSTDLVSHLAMVGLAFAATRMVCGRYVRTSVVFVLVVYAWAFLSEQRDYTSNQYLLLLYLGLIALWRPTGIGPDWGRWAGRLIVSSVYLAAVVAKFDEAWLSGFVFDESLRHYGTLWNRLFDAPPGAFNRGMALATMAIEAFVLVGLWVSRVRRWAILVGIFVHIGIELLLPVRAFSYLMVASYILFITPTEATAWVRRITPRWALWGLSSMLAVAVVFALAKVYPLPIENFGLVALGAILALGWTARREDQTVPTTGWPPKLAAGVAAIWLAGHVALMTKPAFGGDDRFAFRMFREVLIVGTDTRARLQGRWMKFPMHGATDYWPEGKANYYWESWTEHQRFLQGYAEWALANTDAEAIRVVARVRVNGAPTKTVVFTPGKAPTETP